ncbi:hypothetical protein niasHT_016388 [Heterodera trifolii]|uniref:Uncharacterized protein n=1 Tax=Heterodera trifolii TaxID=157864 RepID=A0ABD2LKI4_9BILA
MRRGKALMINDQLGREGNGHATSPSPSFAGAVLPPHQRLPPLGLTPSASSAVEQLPQTSSALPELIPFVSASSSVVSVPSLSSVHQQKMFRKNEKSFLIEPGRPRTDLSKFFAEFDVLESFFDKVELSATESSQKAFDTNSLLKVRNRRLTCADWSRVLFTVPAELVREGITHEEFVATKRHLQIFGDFDCPQISTRVEL